MIGLYVVFFAIIFLIDNFVVINRIDNDSNKPYRLGDSVNRRDSNDILYMKDVYKYSIAADYIRETNKVQHYDTLYKIIKKNTKLRHILYSNYINIHLRTGDVITENYKLYLKKKHKTKNLDINKGAKDQVYVHPLSYYEKVIKYLKKNNINNKNILILTGWHNKIPDYVKINSNKYIEEIKKFFEKNGYNVTIRLNEDPDEDFLIMSNSKYFVRSGGGYSWLICSMVNKNGNIYIDEDTLKNIN